MNKNATTTKQAAAVAEQGAHAAPEQATSTKQATRTKGAPRGEKVAGKGKGTPVAKTATAAKVTASASKKGSKDSAKTSTKKAASTVTVPREFSKKAVVLDLLRRKDGATMAEIAKSTGWQNHSIRGFISGTIGKKLGLAVESTRTEQGDRRYRVATK